MGFKGSLFLLASIVPLSAQVCPPSAKRVYVIVMNGILTTPEAADENRIAVAKEVDAAALKGQLNTPRSCISELPLYNPTLGLAVDLSESASGLGVTDSVIWKGIAGLIDLAAEFNPVGQYLEKLKEYLVKSPSDALQDAVIRTSRAALDSGAGLVFVGHSQGNLVLNRVFFDRFTNAERSRTFGISVATPDNRTPGGSLHTTLEEDNLIEVLVPFSLNGNTSNGPCGSWVACHNLVTSYLRLNVSPTQGEAASEPQIQRTLVLAINQALAAIPVANPSPTAGFTMGFGALTKPDGDTLTVSSSGSAVSVRFDASTRSTDVSPGSISEFRWMVDGTPVGGVLSSMIQVPLAIGSHTISLTVVDNQGAASTPVNGTVVVQASEPSWREITTSITPAGVVGSLVYTGAPNTSVWWTVIADLGGVVQTGATGATGFDSAGHFRLTGADMEASFKQDGLYTIYVFTGLSDAAECANQQVCTAAKFYTRFKRQNGLWSSSAVTQYTITDLGDLPGGQVTGVATAINNVGVVVGYSSGASGADYSGCGSANAIKPFIWMANTGMQPLGVPPPLETDPTFRPCSGGATGLNDQGQVVGNLDFGSGGGFGLNRPFMWSPSTPMTLLAGAQATAVDINNNGQAVGRLSGNAVRWSATGDAELRGISGFNTGATAINNLGEMTGWMQQVRSLPVYWDTIGAVQNIEELPYAFGSNAIFGINDSGQMVGGTFGDPTSSLFPDGGRYAFFWSPSTHTLNLGELPRTVGSPNSQANGINALAQVVGESNGRAFIWTASSSIKDLNLMLEPVSGSGWTLSSAMAINDLGQIVGYGIHNGETRAFILNPSPGMLPQIGDIYNFPHSGIATVASTGFAATSLSEPCGYGCAYAGQINKRIRKITIWLKEVVNATPQSVTVAHVGIATSIPWSSEIAANIVCNFEIAWSSLHVGKNDITVPENINCTIQDSRSYSVSITPSSYPTHYLMPETYFENGNWHSFGVLSSAP